MAKTRAIKMRLAEEDLAVTQALMEHFHCSASELFRRLVLAEGMMLGYVQAANPEQQYQPADHRWTKRAIEEWCDFDLAGFTFRQHPVHPELVIKTCPMGHKREIQIHYALNARRTGHTNGCRICASMARQRGVQKA